MILVALVARRRDALATGGTRRTPERRAERPRAATSRSATAACSSSTASRSTPLFESTINADFQHIVGGGLKLEYHLGDMLSIGVIGVALDRRSTPSLVDKHRRRRCRRRTPTTRRASRARSEFLEHLNTMPFHGAAYISLTPWYGKLAAFAPAYVAFDFYFQAGVVVRAAAVELPDDASATTRTPASRT